MAGETIRVALAGTGSMGQVHAAALAGIPGVAVTAVVDRDPARAAALAASLGAAPYTDLAAMLAGGPVDAIDCCLPTPLHRPTVEWAAAHGLQIICEKPLALSVEDGRAMITACRAAGVQLLMAQVVRFFPEYKRMADAIREGRVGSPVSAALTRQGHFPTGVELWFRDPAKSGGIFVDMMTHDLDWALHQFGPAERVYARLVERPEPRPFAQAMATVRHRSGVLTQATAIWGHPGPFTTSAEVAGSGGLLRCQSGDAQPLRVLAGTATEQRGAVPLPNLSLENPYRTQLVHFAAVLAGQAPPLVRAEESLAALNLALAARTSAVTGRAVPVEEVGV
jgi:predicted dehydrogenase